MLRMKSINCVVSCFNRNMPSQRIIRRTNYKFVDMQTENIFSAVGIL